LCIIVYAVASITQPGYINIILIVNRYPGRGYSGYDVIYSGGYIYVVASSYNQGVDLLKYDKQGNLIWANNFLPFGSPVHPPQLVSDNEGFIYISSVKNLNYAALKISPGGAKIWEFLYPDSTNPGSFVRAMTIDKRKNIYLTGESIGWVCPGDNYDYLTVKISQDKVGINPSSNIISDYKLYQNYPNPFNPSTTIKFNISKKEFVVLKIFDQLGRDVKTLLSKEIPEGTHSVILNAELLSAGIYFYRLTAGEFIQTRKLLLVK
jgi:hypothetical protein